MKLNHFCHRAIPIFTLITVFASSLSLLAEESKINGNINTDKTDPLNLSLFAMNDPIDNSALEAASANATVSEGKGKHGVTFHDILGYGSAGMAIAALSSGSLCSRQNHYLLAGIATGCMTATCLQGWLRYGTLKRGSRKARLHAFLGTLATIGFITTMAIADEKGNSGHIATGAASGAVLAVSIAVFHF